MRVTGWNRQWLKGSQLVPHVDLGLVHLEIITELDSVLEADDDV